MPSNKGLFIIYLYSAMFVDSHCHLDFPDLANNLNDILENMQTNKVSHALCVSVNLEDFPRVLSLAETHHNLYASVGVHPDYENLTEPQAMELASLAQHPRIISGLKAIWSGNESVFVNTYVLLVNVANH